MGQGLVGGGGWMEAQQQHLQAECAALSTHTCAPAWLLIPYHHQASVSPPGFSFPSNIHRNLGGSFCFCPWRRDYVPIQTHFPGKTSQNKEQNWKEGEQSQWEVVP